MNQSRKTEIVDNEVARILFEINQKHGDEIITYSDCDYSTGVINIRVEGGEPD